MDSGRIAEGRRFELPAVTPYLGFQDQLPTDRHTLCIESKIGFEPTYQPFAAADLANRTFRRLQRAVALIHNPEGPNTLAGRPYPSRFTLCIVPPKGIEPPSLATTGLQPAGLTTCPTSGYLAQRVGFEPTRPFLVTVLETAGLTNAQPMYVAGKEDFEPSSFGFSVRRLYLLSYNPK